MSVLPFIMKHFLLILVILTSYSFSFSQDIAGKWYGVAEVMGGKFPIGVQFQEENNVWTADLINPEKEALKMPFDSVTFSNGQVYLNQKRIGFIFAGTVRNDSIIGIAKQNGMDIPSFKLLFAISGTKVNPPNLSTIFFNVSMDPL